MLVSKKTIKTYVVLLIATSTVLTVMLIVVRNSNQQLIEEAESVLPEATVSDQDTYESRLIEHTLLGTIDDVVAKTYNFLIQTPYGGDENLKALTKFLNQQLCSKERCTINLFDDRQAYEVYVRRVELMKSDWGEDYGTPEYVKAKKEWDKANYTIIADHLICSYFFGGEILQFPYRDDYYLTLKSKGAQSDALIEP